MFTSPKRGFASCLNHKLQDKVNELFNYGKEND